MFLGGLAGAVRGQGSALCSLDDVNGDGVRDLAVANREQGKPEQVWILSGKDGALLREWKGETPGEGFGAAAVQLADLDGDGCREVALVAAGGATVNKAGTGWNWWPAGARRVVVISPKSGAIVRRFDTFANSSAGAPSVAPAGDWDQDGIVDVAIGLAAPGGDLASSVRVGSGKSGAVLFRQDADVHGFDDEDRFGADVLSPGDLDGDGAPDLIVGAPLRRRSDGLRRPTEAELPKVDPPQARGSTPRTAPRDDDPGAVFLISGKGGERVTCSFGDEPGDRFGEHLALLPDLDGDGRPEIAVAATSRYVRVLSYDRKERTFRTLITIGSHCGRGYVDEFGTSLDVLPDVDDDGKPELVIGACETWPPGFFDEGYAEVWSLGTGKRISLLWSSGKMGADACALGDVDGDKVPEVALSLVTYMPVEAWGTNQLVRVVSAKDGKKVVWERTIASLRAAPAPQSK